MGPAANWKSPILYYVQEIPKYNYSSGCLTPALFGPMSNSLHPRHNQESNGPIKLLFFS